MIKKRDKSCKKEIEAIKRKLQRTKKRLEDIIKSSSDCIWEIDKNGKYIFVSGGISKILGYKQSDFKGKKIFDFMEKDEVERIKGFFKEAVSEKKPIKDLENWRVSKSGRKVCFLTNGIPIFDDKGRVKGYRGVGKDITQQKEVEKMKNELILLSSHQLRTPLSGIKWGLIALKDEGIGKLSVQQAYYLERIDQFNERMIDLIESLVTVSRIEGNSLFSKPEITDLKYLINRVLEDMKMELEYSEQEFVLDIEKDLPEVNVDRRLIKRVYRNLLTNASKYTPKKGKISLSVFKKGRMIISKVTDNGYGILESQKKRVFEKFFRGENIVKKQLEGLGLGLYFVKTVIAMSGGKVGFESKEGKGSSFWFTLPFVD